MKQTELDERARYNQRVLELIPKSNLVLDCIKAFLVGGLICVLGQLLSDIGTGALKLDEQNNAAFCAIMLVFIGSTLTGIGVYDKLGSFAGAGSIVPITGFANSIVSPAMEFKREGFVFGVGAKMFIIAGPVLVYGVSASIIVGIIALIVQ